MKRSKGHMGPLSDAALAVLAKAEAFRMGESDVVFPGMAGKPMSDMTPLKVLRDMSEPYHVHGFRSSFTAWAATDGFADAEVEAALGHKKRSEEGRVGKGGVSKGGSGCRRYN